MRRVRVSLPLLHFSLQICKNLYKLFVQFVQILLVAIQLLIKLRGFKAGLGDMNAGALDMCRMN